MNNHPHTLEAKNQNSVNPFSPKLQLFTAIADSVESCRKKMLATKQRIPWAGDALGPLHAVTERQVTASMEELFTDLRDLIALAEIASFDHSMAAVEK